MAKIKPFKGVRPPKQYVEEVESRPYDVLDSEEARKEAGDNEKSLYHIIKPEIDFAPGTSEYDPRVYEKADKYPVGKRGNKAAKFVEAAKGTNLFFAVYETEEIDKVTGDIKKKRSYATIPLYEAVKRAKAGLSIAPANADGNEPAFVLSPNDLVYLPTKEDIERGMINMPLDKSRIYKMVSCTGKRLYGIPYSVASSIIDKFEFTQLNKLEFTDNKELIKETCVPIKVDRIGNIIEINGKKP